MATKKSALIPVNWIQINRSFRKMLKLEQSTSRTQGNKFNRTQLLRRTLFALNLLCLEAVCVGINRLGWPRFLNLYPLAGALPCTLFLLASWIVFRRNVWMTKSGMVRAVLYTGIFVFGNDPANSFQEWVVDGTFTWRYSSAIPLLSALLKNVCLLIPIAILLNPTLSAVGETPLKRSKLGIWFILVWTLLVALAIATLPTKYRFHALVSLPMVLIEVVALMIILWGWSQRWYISCAMLVLAVVIDSFGQQLAYNALKPFLSGSMSVFNKPSDRWWIVIDRNLFTWTAFGVAKLLGIVIRFEIGSQEECARGFNKPDTSHATGF
jgi:hypothetical protein